MLLSTYAMRVCSLSYCSDVAGFSLFMITESLLSRRNTLDNLNHGIWSNLISGVLEELEASVLALIGAVCGWNYCATA